MKFPFTIQQFLDVFRNYNTAIFPLQLLFVLLAVIVILLTLRKTNSGRIILLILAAFWFWMGVVYHIIYFSSINKGFGAVFIIEGILLLYFAITRSYQFTFHKDIYSFIGGLLVLYALVIYPIIGQFSDHAYPSAPTFGLPCPTTIFTFGILLLSRYRLPWVIVIVPIVWSVIGFTAALTLGIYEDAALIVSATAFTVLNILKYSDFKLPNSYLPADRKAE